ncbi:2678_t:CDS:1, partial [Gigaspora rosea]
RSKYSKIDDPVEVVIPKRLPKLFTWDYRSNSYRPILKKMVKLQNITIV